MKLQVAKIKAIEVVVTFTDQRHANVDVFNVGRKFCRGKVLHERLRNRRVSDDEAHRLVEILATDHD